MRDLSKQTSLETAVHHLNHLSSEHIAAVDLEGSLKQVKAGIECALDEQKFQARLALRRILLLLPEWRRGSQFIAQNLQSVIYTDREIAELTQLEEAQKNKDVKIEADLRNGVSPWWASIKYNHRNAQNPFIIGFYQDPEGHIRTLFGPRYFKSKREVKTEGLIFGGYNEDKQVNLLATQFQKVKNAELIKSPLFDLLPPDLQERFQNGEILITGDSDLYDFTEKEVEKLVASNNLNSISATIDDKIKKLGVNKQYYLLCYGDYNNVNVGRTGVIMVVENGDLKPLTINVNGKEYVVEVKGCGKKGGGFGGMHYRTGRDIITGGVEKEQAINEFNQLAQDSNEGAVMAVASMSFDNNGYDQGYVIRLSPSTVRASYTACEVYPNIESQENLIRILDIYARQLAEQMFAAKPKIMDRSSHTENILLWGNGNHTFTDFSDHVSLADGHYPYEAGLNGGGYMTPRQMLENYINMVEEIPGYQSSKDKVVFLDCLNSAFKNKGVELGLRSEDGYSEITQKIWVNALSYQVFYARKSGKYRAEAVLKEISDLRLNNSYRTDLALQSQQSFEGKYNEQLQALDNAIILLFSKVEEKDKPSLISLLKAIHQKDLKGVLSYLDEAFKIYRKTADLSREERDQIFKIMLYFGGLQTFFFENIQKYFEHEKDVLDSALLVKTDSVDLQMAKKELEGKIAQFEDLQQNLTQLYNKLLDNEFVRSLLTFSYYQTN